MLGRKNQPAAGADGVRLGPEDSGLSALTPRPSQAHRDVGLLPAQKPWCRPNSNCFARRRACCGVSGQVPRPAGMISLSVGLGPFP